MLVLGDESVAFNRLRAVFAQQIKPPFGITDFVGEYASSGFPRVDAAGGITSANDDVENPEQGNLEFDPIARAIYPRAQFVLHDNDFAGNGTTGDTGKTGNALTFWHSSSSAPSVAYGSVLPGSGAGSPLVQGPFVRTQKRAPGFTSMQFSVGQASITTIDDPYNAGYGASLPVYGDFRMYGEIPSVGGCQGFTGFVRLFPPSDGSVQKAAETTSSGLTTSSSSETTTTNPFTTGTDTITGSALDCGYAVTDHVGYFPDEIISAQSGTCYAAFHDEWRYTFFPCDAPPYANQTFHSYTGPIACGYTFSGTLTHTQVTNTFTGTTSGTGASTNTQQTSIGIGQGNQNFARIQIGTETGSGTAGAISGVEGLAPYTMLAFRLTGSGRAPMRWYSVLWEIGGMVTLCYNDVPDIYGNPLDSGWVVAEKLKMGEGRDAVLEPDSANTYVMGPTPDDWTIGYNGENFPGKITSGAIAGGKAHTEEKLPKNHVVEVRVIGGQVRVVFGSEDTPFMWPAPETNADGVPDWFIDRFMVTGGDVYGAEWSVHPTKWATSAALISNPINMGFVPDAGQLASINYRTHYTPDFKSDAQVMDAANIGFHPDGYRATCETYDTFGTELRYKLAFSNPASGKTYRGLPYAHATSAVRAVGLDVPGTEWSLISPPTILGGQSAPSKPMAIDVYHQFDLGTLSIQSSATLTFNNYSGFWTNGEGSGYFDTKGHIGVGIELGTNVGNTLNREFTGIGHTDFTDEWGGGGKDVYSISCRDCWLFLDVPVWNLPWMDGWNVYYAVAYLAELGTITRGQMDFADLIPDNPYGRSPGLPDDEQYFLPVGPAGTPVTRFGGGESLRSILLKISVSIGFSLFFNVFGQLNFFKFRVAPPSGYTRTFSHVPGSAQNPGQAGTDEIWAGGSYRGGLSDTKNSVTVIGVNAIGPLWDPVVSHQTDEDSIFDDSAPNYKGFPDPMVWTDNLFADAAFADRAASSMLDFLRLPDRQVNFSTWYPGGNPVYPGDLIRVFYPRSAASLHTYFVVSTHASRRKDALPRLDIAARLIPI